MLPSLLNIKFVSDNFYNILFRIVPDVCIYEQEYRGIVQHTTCETMFSIRLEIGKFRINRWLTIGSILNPKKIPRRTESPVKKCFDVEAVVPVESA